jgi:hypothetical protein
MSENSESHGSGTAAFGEAADAYAKFWSDFTSKMTAAAFAVSPGSTPPEAVREVRSAMLKAMGDSCEQYMRSPQFQEALKQWFANSILFRSQVNEWLSRMRHESQGVSRQDIDAVVQAIGRLEARVSDGLQGLSDRLEALETKNGNPPPVGGANPRPIRRVQDRKEKP